MVRIESDLPKTVFFLVFLACTLCCHASLESEFFHSNSTHSAIIDLERFKSDLFSPKINEKFGSIFFEQKNLLCMKELAKIGIGLYKGELWAIKILDSWGKLPSGFLDGNLFELGSFTECLSNKTYESKYCLGAISLEKEKKLHEVSQQQYSIVNNGIFPNIWKSHIDDDDEQRIESRAMMPQANAKPQFKFGMCVPAVCSLNFLQIFANFTKQIELSENTCQVPSTGTKLSTLDIVAIVLLVIVLVLVVFSTGYDIYYTLYNYEKSQAFLAFSVFTNGKKVLSYKKSRSTDTMHCLNGIRVISTQWVVMGHTFVTFVMIPLRNMAVVPTFFTKYENMIIASAPISVDTFFVLSGLLVSMNMLKHLKKSNGCLNIPLVYFHRYLRLTPLLIATVLFSITLLRFLASGPLWPMLSTNIREQCERNWWSTLLYVQNYVNPKDICLPHTWYLSVDMQLFIVAPLVVYLIYWFDLITIFIIIILICGCVAWTLVINVDYGLKSLLSPDKFPIAYVPTHLRCSSYLIGVIAGYIFLKYQNRSIRIPRLFNLFAWALSLLVMVTVIFINYPLLQPDTTATPIVFGLYDALTRVFWSIALCYIIFACIHNSGGPVNRFLSHPLWQPISRLSYAVYLVHFPVIILMMVPTKTSLFFSEWSAFHYFIGNYVLSLCLAFIATLTFESPIIIIEKLLFHSKKEPSPPNENGSIERYNKMDPEPHPNHSPEA